MRAYLSKGLIDITGLGSKGRIVILGRIVSASGQIFRRDFRPQDEIFRPVMAFRPLDEWALNMLQFPIKVYSLEKITRATPGSSPVCYISRHYNWLYFSTYV